MDLKEIYQVYNEKFNDKKLPYIECNNCKYNFYYPRNVCPKCGSYNIKINESNGNGTIYSYTVMNKSTWAIVSLNEGFKMYMNIYGNNPEINKKIKIIFEDSKLPCGEII